jgi:protein-L-isoaspartate O-methyltransferase
MMLFKVSFVEFLGRRRRFTAKLRYASQAVYDVFQVPSCCALHPKALLEALREHGETANPTRMRPNRSTTFTRNDMNVTVMQISRPDRVGFIGIGNMGR